MKGVNRMNDYADLLTNVDRLSELDRKELENLLYYITGAVKMGLENDEIAAETIAKRINKVVDKQK